MQLKNEGPQRSIVYVEEDKEYHLQSDDLEDFEKHLSLDKRIINEAENDVDDTQNEQNLCEEIRLYKCTDESGSFNTTFVKNGPIKQADLDSNVLFFFLIKSLLVKIF